MMDFPRLVYKAADNHLLVKDQEEMDEAVANGWFASVPEASEAGSARVGTATAEKTPVAPVPASAWGKKK